MARQQGARRGIPRVNRALGLDMQHTRGHDQEAGNHQAQQPEQAEMQWYILKPFHGHPLPDTGASVTADGESLVNWRGGSEKLRIGRCALWLCTFGG
jgi:hypothetical protein